MYPHRPDSRALPPPDAEVLQALSSELESLRDEMNALVDDELTPERMAAQQAAILARLGDERGNGRVLHFPARGGVVRRDRPGMRWVAAAAAAGLIVGFGAGGWLRDGNVRPRPADRTLTTSGTPHAPGAAPASTHSELHEEEFLLEIETVLANRRVPELRALDELTPRTATVSTRSSR
ncbi:MAG TPA: hypothetical protein VIL35_10970 [Vicinamibacterales bacterium]